jgi:hypothetical protein
MKDSARKAGFKSSRIDEVAAVFAEEEKIHGEDIWRNYAR